jgi:hypothetical protein
MIEINHVLDPRIGARWRTRALPQHIDPEELPYERVGITRCAYKSVGFVRLYYSWIFDKEGAQGSFLGELAGSH